MTPEFFETIFYFVIQIITVFLIAYYLGMEFLVFALIGKNVLIRLFQKTSQKNFKKTIQEQRPRRAKNFLKELFERSLFFNHTLAILTIALCAIVIISLPDLSSFVKLEIFTVIVSILPYIFSFTRATNVGINGGIIGTIFGLLLFSAFEPGLSWWENSGYFLIITGLANVSGWIGGWVGPGQLREAVSVTVFKATMNHEGVTLSSLVETVQNAINQIIPTNDKNVRFVDQKPTMVITHAGSSFSIVAYKHELEWRQIMRPQYESLKWLFSKDVYSTNQIIDYVFNIFRAKVTKAILISKQSNEISQNADEIYLLVLNYKETPSIVWVDDEITLLSHNVHNAVHNHIQHTDEHNPKVDWNISRPVETIVRQWQPKISLEQYSKDTPGANMPYHVIKERKISHDEKLPADVLSEIIKAPTVFDRVRGQAFAFVSFMFFQVFIGVLINLFSDHLTR